VYYSTKKVHTPLICAACTTGTSSAPIEANNQMYLLLLDGGGAKPYHHPCWGYHIQPHSHCRDNDGAPAELAQEVLPKSDLANHIVLDVDLKLLGVYHHYIHQKEGMHLDGQIEEGDNILQT
jgi:hypothetical protein